MSSKRIAGVIALFMVVSMLLAACGTDTATSTAVVAPTATTAAATMAPTEAATMAPTMAPTEAATIAPTEAPTMVATMAPTAAATAAATGTVATVTTVITSAASTTNDLYSATDCSYGGIVKSIQAVDASTVKFTLCTPDPAFPAKAAFGSLAIHEASQLTATSGGGTDLLEKPIGTGPYMLSEWVRGDHITFVPNPNYWGTAPANKTLIFKWTTEASARLNSLKAGEADVIDNADPNDFASISADTTLKLLQREALNTFYLGFNNTKAPFDNEKVRQAIAMGIDRQAIIDKFYPAGSTVADYFTPCAIPGGCEGDKWYTYDQAAAKQAITDAGIAGKTIRLSYRNVARGYLPTPDKVAEEIQAQLSAVGLTVTIDQEESTTFLDNASAGNLDMFMLGWGADYPDQTDFLDYHFGAGANSAFGNKFPDITAILKQAGSVADQTQRNTLYAQANNLIKQHVPMVPIAHGGSAIVYSAQVANPQVSPLGNERFDQMSVPGKDTLVFIQNGEPGSLYCADETDGESLRACAQTNESLLAYKQGGTETVPGLASSYDVNADLTEYTFHLRSAKFSDGNALTAQDVVATYAAQWDASNPLHVGRTGAFDYWSALFGAFLDAK